LEDSSPQSDAIERFRSAFWDRVRPPLRRLSYVGVLTATIAAAYLAREGTLWGRLSALVLVLATVVWLAALHFRKFQQFRYSRRVLSQIVSTGDPEGGRRALRAVRLLERSLQEPWFGSPALAQHHVYRTLSKVSIRRIESLGRRRGLLFDTLVFVGLLVSGFAAVADGHRVLEGLNVGLSHHGRAPVPMFWLDVDSVTARPPAYLRIGEHPLLFGTRVAEPRGTLIWIRGVPIHPGANLILTNGSRFVHFEGDGEGQMIARWTVEQPDRLRVAARMGQVVIEQGDELIVDPEIDALPIVELENGTRSIQLGQVDRVEVYYRATDDHGLRQIDLVLRSADREERRQLMRLDGQRRVQEGSHAIPVTEPFLKNVHLPVLLRIEARDDNTLVEDTWGHSDWLTLEPPSPGEFEAARVRTLDAVRSALLDWLAQKITNDQADANSKRVDEELGRRAIGEIGLAVAAGHGAWEWPRAVELMLLTNREKLQKLAFSAAKAVQTLESVTLSVDAALHALAESDAQSVAASLADIADDIIRGSRLANASEKRTAGVRRVDDAIRMLTCGGRQLAMFGRLGADLSGIVRATLNRLERSRKTEDFTHVELAAQYLVARLRRPVPSAGGEPSSGVESGFAGQQKSRSSRPAASDANVRTERLLWELQQLREEHKSSLESLERILKGAVADAELDEQSATAKLRADQLRRLAAQLPTVNGEPDSALSSQVVAREQALGMADSIEKLSYGDALTRGRAAHDAANEALNRASHESEPGNVNHKLLHSLREELQAQSQHLEQAMERARQKATRAAAGQLRDQSDRERQLAKRAHALANREKHTDGVVPESMRHDLERASSCMDQASDLLEQSDGDLALYQERRAQSLLDQFSAKPNQSFSGNDGKAADLGKSLPNLDNGTVLPTGDPEAAAAFRQRVQRGLSQETPGELGSTIRRYAEGLLR
jgi:hypothetical protein